MASNRHDTVSNIYLTVSSELLYGEGEEMSTTPCYDEVCQNSSQWNYISGRFTGSGNNDNNNTNSSSNYYNTNIYESLRKKKECYLHDLINNAAFSTPCQQTLSKKQKLKQLLQKEVWKNKGRICFFVLLICVSVNAGALVYKLVDSAAAAPDNSSQEYFPIFYYDRPWYITDTGIYSDGCDKKNYKSLLNVKIVKIKRSCDKIPECAKEIKKMATSPEKKFNFIVDHEGNVYKGLNWQCTMISDTLFIGYFDTDDDCMDCSMLLAYFIHIPEVVRYGKVKGMLKPVLNVNSDCYSDLMNAFFKTMEQ